MATIKQIEEHAAFIKWFSDQYPQLCGMYCQLVTPAVDETGLVLNWKNLDTNIASTLYGIISEYNYLYKRTG